HASRLFADSAIVDFNTNNMSAYGSVVVKSDSGFFLFTQSLTWNHEYRMVSTPDSVMFTNTLLDTFFSVGFESDADLTHYKFFNITGVTGYGANGEN
ncbi:hypothetical protein ACFLZR_02355, partial [Candidatus Neomarinimicrobiota bacterium]